MTNDTIRTIANRIVSGGFVDGEAARNVLASKISELVEMAVREEREKQCGLKTRGEEVNPYVELVDKTLNDYAAEVHKVNAKWWVDLETGQPLKRNVGELLMLTVSELAEAMEGHRKNLQDDKLPHRKMFEVELADAVIRILDIAAGLKLDLHGAYMDKMAYNATRADHQPEYRKSEHGKKY